MYEYFEGKLVEKNPTYAVIDCEGVGYVLNISLNTYTKIGNSEKCKLYAHFVVREDAHLLFGFADTSERELFRQLISVNGVGAATARMILSSLSPNDIHKAITTGDVPTLKAVKGIGEKTAQRIILDLSGKLGKSSSTEKNFLTTHNKLKEDALGALIALGFARSAAEKAIDKSIQSNPADRSVEELIKDTLKNL